MVKHESPLGTLVKVGVLSWTYVFLFDTPRGDRILDRIGKIAFPEWLCK